MWGFPSSNGYAQSHKHLEFFEVKIKGIHPLPSTAAVFEESIEVGIVDLTREWRRLRNANINTGDDER